MEHANRIGEEEDIGQYSQIVYQTVGQQFGIEPSNKLAANFGFGMDPERQIHQLCQGQIQDLKNLSDLKDIQMKQKSISAYQRDGSRLSLSNFQQAHHHDIIIPSFHQRIINNPRFIQNSIIENNKSGKNSQGNKIQNQSQNQKGQANKTNQTNQTNQRNLRSSLDININLPAINQNNIRLMGLKQREGSSYSSVNNNQRKYSNVNTNIMNSRNITNKNLEKLSSFDVKDQPRSKSIEYQTRLDIKSKNIQKDFINGIKLPHFSMNKITPQVSAPQKQVRKTTQTFKQRQLCLKQYFSPSDILEKYKILSHIGKGSFSIVSLAIQSQTKKRFAIKTYIKIDQIQIFKFQNVQRQIQNLFALHHKNIVGLQHAVQDKRKILLIMEDAGKQSLAGLLRKLKTFDEAAIKFYLKQMLEGLNYCHQKKICHRDLKLENVLVDQRNNIKIIDFGFSIDSITKLSTYCGTPPYMAPEVTLKVLYNGAAADVWSLGVIVYMMAYGKFPFRANNQKELYRIIQQGKIIHIDQKSMQLKQMINKMMRVDPTQRATAEQLLKSSWLSS